MPKPKPTVSDVLKLIAEAKAMLELAVPMASREKLLAQARLDEAAMWVQELRA